MHAIALSALVVAAGIEIDGSSECPTSAQVALELAQLSGGVSPGAPREHVELTRDGGSLIVRLAAPSGIVLAERRIPGGDCAELARAAAVLVAAWRMEMVARTPELELKPPRSHPALELDIGAGFTASLANGSAFAPGASLAVALGPWHGRVLGRLALTGADVRSLPIGSGGQARYSRVGFALGPLVRFRPRRLLLDLFAEATAALLYMDAVGYISTHAVIDFDVGLGGGGRLAVRLGPVAPFVGARVVGWLTEQSVRVRGNRTLGGVAGLPRLELLLEAGIAFGIF